MNSEDQAVRKGAYDELVSLVYQDLRRRARQQLATERADSVHPTVLVHEAYERLLGYHMPFENREHFFNVAATAMRRFLIERARKVRTAKRGGGNHVASLADDDDALGFASSDPDLLIDIDRALETLRPEHVRLVELRFFVGFTLDETADILGIKPDTAKKRWVAAKTLLFDKLQKPQ